MGLPFDVVYSDLILEKINLECTKRAFFYKGAKIFNNF